MMLLEQKSHKGFSSPRGPLYEKWGLLQPFLTWKNSFQVVGKDGTFTPSLDVLN